MLNNYTREQMTAARKADLYDFLTKNHDSDFKAEGINRASIHPRNNKSLSIKRGYSGYTDFATGETGNSVDFLVKHMNYTIVEAVLALAGNSISVVPHFTSEPKIKISTQSPEFVLPEPAKGMYKQLFMYLTKSRGISAETVRKLIDLGILYQYCTPFGDKVISNIAFVNKERDFAETHGTNTYKSFHGIIPNSRHNGFWWFQPHPDQPTEAVFVCEAAIDAISLYELNRKNGKDGAYVYVSISGCTKQQAIDRLKAKKRVILAVDNDKAGQGCRDRNPELEYILPKHKDWNEDLIS